MNAQLDLFSQTIGMAPFRIGSAGSLLPGCSDRYITLQLYLDPPDEILPPRDSRRPRVSFRVDTGWKIEPGSDRNWYEEVARYFAVCDLDPRRPATLRSLCYKRPDDTAGYGGNLGYGWSHVQGFRASQAFQESLMDKHKEAAA